MRPHHTIIAVTAGMLLAGPLSPANAQFQCDPGGDCLEPHELPGCADLQCCETVCTLDPFCCKSWDIACAEAANATCTGLCGADASGSCFSPHPTPGCDDAECCDLICGLDSFCCSVAWDANCAFLAGFSCSSGGGRCGDAEAGDCFESNGTPACSDATCCDAVCLVDPRCCEVVWDSICVAIANSTCLGGCEITPANDAIAESEGCGTDANDPCDGGTAQIIAGPSSVWGTWRNGADTDVYEIDLAPFDLDGDGLVRIRTTTVTNTTATLSIVPADCDEPDLLSRQLPACVDQVLEGCVPAGPIWVRMSTTNGSGLCDDAHYQLMVELRDTCDDPCGTGGDCLETHDTAGCDDPACCASVCELDPSCCDWEWDTLCSRQAAQTCGGDPPANDACVDATEIVVGSTPFRSLLATLDGPTDWCGPDPRPASDVWFRHRVACDGPIFIGTCGSADFDTVVEVYRGDCSSGLVAIACNDDSGVCTLGTSTVEVTDGICGEELLIRVLPADGDGGNGQISVSCFGQSCPCLGDLDGDGRVSGSDLGRMFISWGPCPRGCTEDLDGDGAVDGADLGLLFIAWGDC